MQNHKFAFMYHGPKCSWTLSYIMYGSIHFCMNMVSV